MGPPPAASPAGAVDATAGVSVKVSNRYVSPHPLALLFSFYICRIGFRVMGMC